MGRQVNFKIGLIGCGLVGYKRVKSLGSKGQLVACADLKINRAKKIAFSKKIKIFTGPPDTLGVHPQPFLGPRC